jgi:predicted DNA-binding transcriptional regulator AlpA
MTTGTLGDDEDLLTEQDAAELLQVPLSTLRRWQREGAGPPCLKIGRQVRYRQVAAQRWLTGSLQAGSRRAPLAPRPSAPAGDALVASGSLRATASCR